MEPSSPDARGRLRQALDDEIKALEESTRASKYRRNALVPVSRLPPEILTEIFAILSSSTGVENDHYLEWLRVTHVCHNWREIALNCPRLWCHINFTRLTPTGITEILARAKMAPLHLEARPFTWNKEKLDAFEKQLETHISHTHYLRLSGEIQDVVERLVFPAPSLESLILSTLDWPPQLVIRDALFNHAIPKLRILELTCCDISWKSPLLKGLQTLKILNPSVGMRPTLDIWLDALDAMPQLKMLTLDSASPINSPDDRFNRRTVTLPYLTRFDITASTHDCTLALAHLNLPALISLYVNAEFHDREGNDVVLLIPHVVRNAYGPQGMAPLQSMSMRGEDTHIMLFAWTLPDADIQDCHRRPSARVSFIVTPTDLTWWRYHPEIRILDAFLRHLPTNAISTLTVEEDTQLNKDFWQSHVSSLPMLRRVRLFSTAVKAFREALAEDSPSNGVRFPRLTKLILVNFPLTALGTYRLRDMFRKRVEQGAPLESLDLRTCTATERAIELLAETVGDVQGPAKLLETGNTSFFNWKGGVDFFDEEEKCAHDDKYEIVPNPWYDSTGSDEDEESEDKDEDEDEEGDGDGDDVEVEVEAGWDDFDEDNIDVVWNY